jgi:hypothetical protein
MHVEKSGGNSRPKNGTKTFRNHLEFSSLKIIRDKVREREWLKQR